MGLGGLGVVDSDRILSLGHGAFLTIGISDDS